jgi:hypothetical protein
MIPSQRDGKVYPKGIKSSSPALTDEMGLRRVVNHKLKSTLKELNQAWQNGDTTPLGFFCRACRTEIR